MQLRVYGSLLVLCSVLPATGCLARYRTNPVEVTVTRGVEQEPVAGAKVRVEYPDRDLLTAPPSPRGVTNEEGKITLPIANLESATITIASVKDAETPFKEQFKLSKTLIQDGGVLERENAIQAASWNGPTSLQLTLENRRWRPAFMSRFRKSPEDESDSDGVADEANFEEGS